MIPHELLFPTRDTPHPAQIPPRQSGLRLLWSNFCEQPFFGVGLFQNGGFLFVNERWATMMGCTVEEFVTVPAIVDSAFGDELEKWHAIVLDVGEGNSEEARIALRARRTDGSALDLEVRGRRVYHNGRPAILFVLADVSERVLEEQRRSTAALHALVHQVAHDISNVLGAIGAIAQLMAIESVSHDDVRAINQAVQRGAVLCRRLVKLGTQGIRVGGMPTA